jgi:hypothetical protein
VGELVSVSPMNKEEESYSFASLRRSIIICSFLRYCLFGNQPSKTSVEDNTIKVRIASFACFKDGVSIYSIPRQTKEQKGSHVTVNCSITHLFTNSTASCERASSLVVRTSRLVNLNRSTLKK